MSIEFTRSSLTNGTESLSQLPLGELQERFGSTANVAPPISTKVTEIASIIGEVIAKVEEGFSRDVVVKKHLDEARVDYRPITNPYFEEHATPAGKELGRRFARVSRHTRAVVGDGPCQADQTLGLVRSLGKMQEHLAALEAEIASYEVLRTAIVGDVDQAEIARAETIEQVNTILGDL